jgi:hypothetical protein
MSKNEPDPETRVALALIDLVDELRPYDEVRRDRFTEQYNKVYGKSYVRRVGLEDIEGLIPEGMTKHDDIVEHLQTVLLPAYDKLDDVLDDVE